MPYNNRAILSDKMQKEALIREPQDIARFFLKMTIVEHWKKSDKIEVSMSSGLIFLQIRDIFFSS